MVGKAIQSITCGLILLMAVGCETQPGKTTHGVPDFSHVYEQMLQSLPEAAQRDDTGVKLTLSADDMPLSRFVRFISDEARVSVVVDATLDDRLVTVDVVDVPLDDLLGVVARRLNVQVTRTGRLFFIGNLRPEDRGVLVRKVGRIDKEGLRTAVGVLLSQFGQVVSFEDGLVVVSDVVEVLSRVHELLDRIDTAPVGSWVVQLHVISMSQRAESEFGFDARPALEVAATFATGSGSSSVDVSGGLQAMLIAEASRDDVNMVASPTFLLVDGKPSSFVDAQEIPVPVRSTSDQGTVTTLSFDVTQVGFTVSVLLRELSGDRALLSVESELSTLQGFVETSPIKNVTRFVNESAIHASGVYLLGSLKQRRQADGVSGPLNLLVTDDDSHSTLQYWCRAYRINGDVDG